MNESLPKEISQAVHGALAAMPKEEAPKYDFPWPEIRDFITVQVSLILTRQSLMVGEQMLEKGAPGVEEEQVQSVRVAHAQLMEQLKAVNAAVESKLLALEGKGPRIVLPR